MNSPTPVSQKSFAQRVLPKLLVSLVLGGLFAWVASRGGVPLLPSREAFAQVKWWAVPGYILALAVTHFVRATRWRFLIAPVKHVPLKEVVAINWIGFFAIFVMPLRLGELARPALSKIREGIPISAGVGTVAVERILDGLITSACVAWAIFALPRLPTTDPIARNVPYYGMLALTVFACAFVALGLFLWQRNFAVKLTEITVGLVAPKLARTLAEKIDQVALGVRSIADIKLASGFLFESLLYWALNAAGMWLLAWGCGIPMSPGHAVAVMGVLAIGILLPAGPGLFGTFQLGILVGLKLYFPEQLVSAAGGVYIFLLYGIQLTGICLAGIIPLYAMQVRFSDLVRAPGPKTIPPPPA
ncbi:MAG: flippase-like domain-containing protein [Sandaracinaceae bacterium]|nr:flippase-like domain-containing protein [Sandaracinaceae bacterium]